MTISRANRSGITVSSSPLKARSLASASGLPSAPYGLSQTDITSVTASVSWTAPVQSGDASITSYVLTITPSVGSVSYAGTSATISGLSPNTSYSIKVQAVNTIGTGSPSNDLSVTTTNTNYATGGTVTEVANYNGTGETWRVHSFNSDGTFVVQAAPVNFSVLLVGGGNNSGGCGTFHSGWGGAGGKVYDSTTATLAVTTYSVSVATGAGYNTTVSSYTSADGAAGGSGGAGRYSGGAYNGYPGGDGPVSTVSGTSTNYGGGGGGGGFGDHGCGSGAAGGAGGGGYGGHGCRDSTVTSGSAGSANTGGGGGGPGARGGVFACGSTRAGGSGKAVIAYKK